MKRGLRFSSMVGVFCSFLLLIVAATFAAAQPDAHVATNGITTLTAHSNGSRVLITIATHEVQNGTPSQPTKPKHSACTMSRMPCSVVDALSVTVNGKALFVPRSIFCDLADLGGASIKAAGHGWVLTLVGGDASESYQLTIEFDLQSINHRTFTDLESGEKVQETNYYQVVTE